MIPNPIHKVLSTTRAHRVQALLMGGQACVFYGAATRSWTSPRLQSIFRRAPRRTMWKRRGDVDSRGGCLKIGWTEPRGTLFGEWLWKCECGLNRVVWLKVMSWMQEGRDNAVRRDGCAEMKRPAGDVSGAS